MLTHKCADGVALLSEGTDLALEGGLQGHGQSQVVPLSQGLVELTADLSTDTLQSLLQIEMTAGRQEVKLWPYIYNHELHCKRKKRKRNKGDVCSSMDMIQTDSGTLNCFFFFLYMIKINLLTRVHAAVDDLYF